MKGLSKGRYDETFAGEDDFMWASGKGSGGIARFRMLKGAFSTRTLQPIGHCIATWYNVCNVPVCCKANGDRNQLGAWLDSDPNVEL